MSRLYGDLWLNTAQRESTQAKKKAKISDGDTVEAVAPQGDDDAKEEEVANLGMNG